jgi:hypothetical protein
MVKIGIRPNIRAVIIAVMAFAVAMSPLTATAQAQTNRNSKSINNSTNVLKISPVRTDIQIKPGETKTVRTVVTNLTSSAITVRPIQNDFIAGDESGTPALILDADKKAPTHSLKQYMKPLSDVTIAANKSEAVIVTLAVPASAQAGGYFGAVRFAPTDPNGGGQVNLNASVASLILMTVPGETVEKVDLTDFSIKQDGVAGSFFQKSENLSASVRFQNKGNLQAGPLGKISVKNGDKVVYEADFNNKDPKDVILPDSARKWEVPLKNISGFGNYTVSATFTYGTKNQTIEVERSFWVVPLGYIIAAVVGLIVLVLLGVGIWLFLRGYKKRVLRKHTQSTSTENTHTPLNEQK